MSIINVNQTSLLAEIEPLPLTHLSFEERTIARHIYEYAVGALPLQETEPMSPQRVTPLEAEPAIISKNDPLFERMLKDLYTFEDGLDALTPYQFKIAKETIQQYREIDASAERINSESGDAAKNNLINKLLSGAGAEGGFSAIPVETRIGTFLSCYDYVKDNRDQLRGFFNCFSTGDTCLSGKTERMNTFYASLILPPGALAYDINSSLELPAYVLSLIMSEDYFDIFERNITLENLKDYLEGISDGVRHINDMAELFQQKALSDSEKFQAFIASLSERGIYTATEINYRELVLRFIDSDVFRSAHLLALTFLG